MGIKSSYWDLLVAQVNNTIEILGTVLLLVLPGVTLAIIISSISGLFFLFKKRVGRADFISLLGVVSVFSFVAFILGFVSANARETVIGDIAPILVAGFGSLLVYSFVKGQIQQFSAGIAAITFSISLLMGLVTGGQVRENGFLPNIQSAKEITKFSNAYQTSDKISGHRIDLASYNALLLLVDKFKSNPTVVSKNTAIDQAIIRMVVPRRNFHMQRSFSDEEMDRYRLLLKDNPGIKLIEIQKKFKGIEGVLMGEIHYALNPLESFNL